MSDISEKGHKLIWHALGEMEKNVRAGKDDALDEAALTQYVIDLEADSAALALLRESTRSLERMAAAAGYRRAFGRELTGHDWIAFYKWCDSVLPRDGSSDLQVPEFAQREALPNG